MQNAIQFLLIYLFYLHSLKVLRHILYRVLYFFPTNWSFPTTRNYKMSRRRPRKCKIGQCSVPARALLGTCSLHARYDLHAWYIWVNIVEIILFCFAVYFSIVKRIENTPIQQSHQSQLEKRSHIWIGGILVDIMYFSSPCFIKKKPSVRD